MVPTSHELVCFRIGHGGQAIVLLHPVGLDGHVWTTLSGLLAPQFTVIVPTLRGHGAAAGSVSSPPWRMQDLAIDVHELLRTEQLGPAHIVGLSLGGMVAQQLALDFPQDVASLVLIGTAPGFDGAGSTVLRERGRRAVDGGMSAVLEETLTRWFAPVGRNSALARDVGQRLASNDPRIWAATWDAMADFDVRQRIAELRHTVLVIGGSDDVSIPPAVSTALADGLPNAELHIVPGAGHLGVLEHPEDYAPLITSFLHRAIAPPPSR